MAQEPLAAHTLYLAPTRPAKRWGVPAEGLFLNTAGNFILVPLLTGTVWLWFVIWPAVHFGMRHLANKNPNFFRELRMWAATKLAIAGSTLYCLPSGNRRGKGMRSCV